MGYTTIDESYFDLPKAYNNTDYIVVLTSTTTGSGVYSASVRDKTSSQIKIDRTDSSSGAYWQTFGFITNSNS